MPTEKLTVAILVTVPRPELFDNNTLVFKTLRTGFPTARVIVTNNNRNQKEMGDKLEQLIDEMNMLETWNADGYYYDNYHHSRWIEEMVNKTDGPLIILDPDTILYDNCEGFNFPTLLAGHHVPVIYNEFSRTLSYERLHTSFLWIKDCKQLRDALRMAYAPAHDTSGEYCPCNPYAPDVKFVRGMPMFWDTTSNLYNMLGGTAFTSNELDRYTHVNSAAFYDVMMERVRDKAAFAEQHRRALEEPETMKGFWKAEDRYYDEMHRKALDMMRQLGIHDV